MTRVLHVQKVSGVSGSEAHLLSVLPLLRERDWDARMIVLHEGEEGARTFVDEMRTRGVPTEAWRMRGDLDPTVPLRLLRRRAAILHTHLVHADVLGLPAGALARIPLRVSTKHGFNEFREHRLVAAADRAAARFAHAQIAISHGLAAYLVETEGFSRDAFRVVHYGIAAGPEPPPPPAPTRLAAVGRLIPIKGYDVLMRAFALAREQVPALTLELAGAGPLDAELRRAAPPGVTLLGRVAPVAGVYERNAIVVVPSRGEGFGMVALEAAERGRAAIVSRVGGLPEIVADGETGVVVPPEDAGALAAAIVALATDPGRVAAYGSAARARALGSFSEGAAADGVDAVYRHLASRRSTTAAASSASTKSNETR
ncbi:MAG TPA: glycosyltransferase family 4 protein [Gaiellaceae bacterium]|nr:glycosyltransferase family 4 protein [Gaiellaceae bacterium]